MTIFLALFALVLSAIPIVALCIGDPKRRRTVGRKEGAMPSDRRRLLLAIACAPGLACALLGDAPAFLIWLGGCVLIGWTLAARFPAHPSR